MKRSSLLASFWGIAFAACAGLGFMEDPGGAAGALMTGLSIVFFVPGFLLLREEKLWQKRVLWISGASLVLTVAALIGCILTAGGSEALGNAMHAVLVIVSAPMIVSRYWVLSLFLWACLLFTALRALRGKKG